MLPKLNCVQKRLTSGSGIQGTVREVIAHKSLRGQEDLQQLLHILFLGLVPSVPCLLFTCAVRSFKLPVRFKREYWPHGSFKKCGVAQNNSGFHSFFSCIPIGVVNHP